MGDTKFQEIDVAIHVKKGDGAETRPTRALVHPGAPGLAVTMNNFGIFDVTHTASGMAVVKGYERMGSAALALAHLSRLADWTIADGKAIAQQIKDHADEPCGVEGCTVASLNETRPMTKMELFQSIRSPILRNELPWESPDDDPWAVAIDILSPRESADVR
jgi:hypothetical protein